MKKHRSVTPPCGSILHLDILEELIGSCKRPRPFRTQVCVMCHIQFAKRIIALLSVFDPVVSCQQTLSINYCHYGRG